MANFENRCETGKLRSAIAAAGALDIFQVARSLAQATGDATIAVARFKRVRPELFVPPGYKPAKVDTMFGVPILHDSARRWFFAVGPKGTHYLIRANAAKDSFDVDTAAAVCLCIAAGVEPLGVIAGRDSQGRLTIKLGGELAYPRTLFDDSLCAFRDAFGLDSASKSREPWTDTQYAAPEERTGRQRHRDKWLAKQQRRAA